MRDRAVQYLTRTQLVEKLYRMGRETKRLKRMIIRRDETIENLRHRLKVRRENREA